MFGIGWTELLIVGVIALIFLGEDKFPEFVKVALRAFKDFRGYWDEIKGQVENEVRRPLERELKPLQRELANMSRNEPSAFNRTEPPSVTPPVSAPEGAYSNTSPDMGTPHEVPVTAPEPEPDMPAGNINSEDAKVMQAGAMPYVGGGLGARPAPEPVAPEAPAASADDEEPVAPSRID